MKKLAVLFSFIVWCGFSIAQDEPLDRDLYTKEDLIAASASFEEGNADTPSRYYSGILAGMVHVDEFLNTFMLFDDENAPTYRFRENIAECLSIINQTRNSLNQYKFHKWALQKKMYGKTLDWLKAVEGLMTDYMIKLADPLSRSDSTWVEEEFKFYDRYLKEYEKFFKIDDDWVAFQYVFAEENDFDVEGEVEIGEVGRVFATDTSFTAAEIERELQDLKDEAESFAQGNAADGFVYFQGILAQLVLIDLDIRRFEILDDKNASVKKITENGDTCLTSIKALHESMAFYTEASWPLREQMHENTVRWLNSVEILVNEYYFKMAEALSRSDDTWTDADWEFYERYLVAMENYYTVDEEWVEFQYEYAEANDFEIGWIIDEDALLEPSADE